MKVSQLTAEYTAQWLGLAVPGEQPSAADSAQISTALAAAVRQATGYTGLTQEELDDYEDITLAVLGLCNDMLVNNRPEAATTVMNRMSEGILAMHCKNLL